MSATNSRTPRSGMPARTRGGGRAAGGLDRQRARNLNMFGEPTSSSASGINGQFSHRRNVENGENREVTTSSGIPSGSSALERAKAMGVGLPIGQNELKIRVRRKGQPAVPVTDWIQSSGFWFQRKIRLWDVSKLAISKLMCIFAAY
uniref:Uncharacterized protein n=2 Tax=Caenorhabditis japonica TaxID=281687 RepID=A0A8R1I5X0_CAEJA